MNPCEEYDPLLDAYIDGELSEDDARRVALHLEQCPACRDYVDAILAIRSQFPDETASPVPEGFAGGVMAAISALPVRRQRRYPYRLALGLAACCALLVLVRQTPMLSRSFASPSAAPAEAAMAMAEEDGAPLPAAGGETPSMEESRNTGALKVAPSLAAPIPEAEDAGAPLYACESAEAEDAPIFSATVYLTQAQVGDHLAGLAPFPYARDGVTGTGYAMEQTDFEALLAKLSLSKVPDPDPARTTELCCIVVTD